MTSRCAVFVDAGYALAAAATRVTGTSLRGGIHIDYEQLITGLTTHAERQSGLPLLRVHWYDAARDGVPDSTQRQIGLLSRVKLRLGRIGFDGEQKGVDLRIGLDLVSAARNAAVEVVYLVSGDDDLTEAVDEAQAHGVQVIVLAVPLKTGEPYGLSRHLQTAADGMETLDADTLDHAITSRRARATNTAPLKPASTAEQRPAPTPAILAHREPRPMIDNTVQPAPVEPAAAPATLVFSSSTGGSSFSDPAYVHSDEMDENIDHVVDRLLHTWLEGDPGLQHAACAENRPEIPRDVDRALLLDLSEAVGVYDLSDPVRHHLRARFWVALDRRTS